MSFISQPSQNFTPLHVVGKDGQEIDAAYTVPMGQTLIITSVDFFPDFNQPQTLVILSNPAEYTQQLRPMERRQRIFGPVPLPKRNRHSGGIAATVSLDLTLTLGG